MPRGNRLTRADLQQLQRSRSHRVHGELFSLQVAALPGTAGPKAACVVSKKVSPRATERNALKRRCREALRPLMQTVNRPLALVFHAKRTASGASAAAIAADVRALVQRAEA